ncbi:hypothetical protein LV779_25730 [Streptomyces thinghirensis]|nr:hypothetical protein [Streptomyces thinghirensis]
MKDLVIAAGEAAARPVSWREGFRPGKGRSGFKRMYSRFVAPAGPSRRTRRPQGHRRSGTARAVAARRMADR